MKIEGYVLDERTKQPISNVLVEFKERKLYSSNDDSPKNAETKLYTDENGFFSVTVNEKKYDLFPAWEINKVNYKVGGASYEPGLKKMKIKIYLRKIAQ